MRCGGAAHARTAPRSSRSTTCARAAPCRHETNRSRAMPNACSPGARGAKALVVKEGPREHRSCRPASPQASHPMAHRLRGTPPRWPVSGLAEQHLRRCLRLAPPGACAQERGGRYGFAPCPLTVAGAAQVGRSRELRPCLPASRLPRAAATDDAGTKRPENSMATGRSRPRSAPILRGIIPRAADSR